MNGPDVPIIFLVLEQHSMTMVTAKSPPKDHIDLCAPQRCVSELVLQFAIWRWLHAQYTNRFNRISSLGQFSLQSNEIVGSLGRTHRRRFPIRNPAITGDLPPAFRNHRETWSTPSSRNRSSQRALCRDACRRTGVRGR